MTLGSNVMTATKAAVLAVAAVPHGQAFVAPTGPSSTLIDGLRIVESMGSDIRLRRSATVMMGIAGPDDNAKVAICGPRSGIAGLVATRLSTAGGQRQVVLVDESLSLPDKLGGAKVVVASSDGGPDGEEAPPGLANEVVQALSPSTEYLVWIDSPEGRAATKEAKAEVGFISGLLGQGLKEPLEAVRSVEGNVRCVIMHAGRLFGAAGGPEPVPFLTGPKAEPVLDESITRQAVLVGPGTVLSASEDAATKRTSIAEAIERILEGPERRTGLEISVVSVEGFAASDDEWQEELKRLDDVSGVAVFSLDFESIVKKEQFISWLTDSWVPAILRKSTAAMLRSGARPVAVSGRSDGIDILWETLTEDLNPVEAGRLSVNILEEPVAGIRVVRVTGDGQPQGKALSGEEEIVQSILEGINTVAYPKGFVTRKILKKASKRGATIDAKDEAVATAEAGTGVGGEAIVEGVPAPTATPPAAAETTAEAAAQARRGRGRRSGRSRNSS